MCSFSFSLVPWFFRSLCWRGCRWGLCSRPFFSMGLLASLFLFSPAFLCDYVRLWFGGAVSFMVMWLSFALDFSGSRARLFILSSTFLSGCVICLTVPQFGPVELILYLNVWLLLPPSSNLSSDIHFHHFSIVSCFSIRLRWFCSSWAFFRTLFVS